MQLTQLFRLLQNWQFKLVLIISIILAAYIWHKAEIKIAVNTAVVKVEADIREQSAKENIRLSDKALTAQTNLQDKFNKLQKDNNREISNLRSRVLDLTNSLSNRPNRPDESTIPNSTRNTESRSGATGSQLYRQDAIFLAGEASGAEEIRLELLSCYKKYDKVKDTLDKFKRDNQ